MEIVFVASEMVPYASTGGLGDVLGSLPQEIAKLGHRVSIFIPRYKRVAQQGFALEPVEENLHVPLGSEVETASVFFHQFGELNIFLVAHSDFFERDELYGTPMGDYPDNDRRFTFFQRAVIEALKRLKLKPDVIHCHDWQSGLIPVYLKTLYQGDPFFKKTKTVFTIHNLAYQGNFPPDSFPLTGLSWDEFRLERLEFYGKVSFLKGGLIYSDVLTTVSCRYAEEIQTQGFGCGLESVLSRRREDLVGIMNGINPEEWDPERDPVIRAGFSARNLEGKKVCKAELQKENHLKPGSQIPLFGFVGRLAEQKGIDILAPLVEEMARENWQLVILGTGEEEYHKLLRLLHKRHPEHLGLNITFDPKTAKRIYSGADFFLMPSRYEPCGLGPMFSLRFGTIPIVRETGGLVDMIQKFDANTGKGNGFIFSGYKPEDLLEAMRRAVDIYRDEKLWTKLVRNGMACDFSWAQSARQYAAVYERAERKSLQV